LPRQIAQRFARRASIARVDVGTPALERSGPFGRRLAAVGNIVDRAAERVNLVHRVTLRCRQNAHREIKRAARGNGSGVGLCIVHDWIGNGQDNLR
jgi:hypothetical protein